MEKRLALGKGLSALIPDAPEPRASTVEADIDRISPNDFQPRAHVDDARLQELAQSIRTNGVIIADDRTTAKRRDGHYRIQRRAESPCVTMHVKGLSFLRAEAKMIDLAWYCDHAVECGRQPWHPRRLLMICVGLNFNGIRKIVEPKWNRRGRNPAGILGKKAEFRLSRRRQAANLLLRAAFR